MQEVQPVNRSYQQRKLKKELADELDERDNAYLLKLVRRQREELAAALAVKKAAERDLRKLIRDPSLACEMCAHYSGGKCGIDMDDCEKAAQWRGAKQDEGKREPEEARQMKAERMSRLRMERIVRGLCPRCGGERMDETRVLCERCRMNEKTQAFYKPQPQERNTQCKRELRERYRNAGLCACGRELTDGYKTCAVCRERNRAKAREWYRRHAGRTAKDARQEMTENE